MKALLNDLTYLMDDSLDRIADVQAINKRRADPAKWSALTSSERQTSEAFRASQVRPGPVALTCSLQRPRHRALQWPMLCRLAQRAAS